jgi:hypothetical protein
MMRKSRYRQECCHRISFSGETNCDSNALEKRTKSTRYIRLEGNFAQIIRLTVEMKNEKREIASKEEQPVSSYLTCPQLRSMMEKKERK